MNPKVLKMLKKKGGMFSGKTKMTTFALIHAPIIFGIISVVVAIFLVISMLVVIFDDDDDESNSCDSSGPVVADFKITPVGANKKVSVAIEKWCAKKGLTAGQTSAILGSAQQESTMGNATSNLLGWSNSAGTNADHSHDTSNVDKYMDDFTYNIGNEGHQGRTFKLFKQATKNDDAHDCEMYWSRHIEVCAVFGERVKFAEEFYKQISGGKSDSSSDASSTASSGSDSCGDSSGDTDDIIAYSRHYLGLGYSQASRIQGAKDIAEGKPKRETAETDCSGFTWSILKHCGYKVTSSVWTVGSGCLENTTSDLKHVSSSSTHAGSVVLADSNPHTSFLMSKWHGENSTKVMEEGGYSGNVNENENYAFAYGSNNSPSVFANPIKK